MAKGKSKGAGRDVLFRVGVEAHPQTKQILSDLGKQIAATQDRLGKSMERAAARAKTAASEIEKSFQKAYATTSRGMAEANHSAAAAMRGTSTADMATMARRGHTVSTPATNRDRDERIERDTNLRQAAAEAARRRKEQERADAEAKRQRQQAALNVRHSGATTGSQAAQTFAAKPLQEQEELIAKRIAGETRAVTAVQGLQGKALADRRQVVAQKISLLQEELAATTVNATQAHAVESAEIRKTLAERRRTIGSSIRELQRYDGELKRQVASEEKEAERLHHRHRQRQQSIAKANRRHLDATLKDNLAATKAMDAEHAQSVAKIRSSNQGMATAFGGMTEGAAKATRGFLMLGLVGEENTQKLMDGFLKIQGGFDILTGGVKTANEAAKFMRLYKEATAAARIATDIAAAKTLAHSAALGAEATSATAAAAAHGRLAAAKALSSGGGGLPGGLGGASKAARAAGTAGKLGRAAGMAGKLAGAGGGLGMAALPAVGGVLAPVAALVAAVVGTAAAITSLGQTVRDVRENGFGGGARRGTFTDDIANGEARFFSRIDSKLGQGSFRGISGGLLGGMSHIPGANRMIGSYAQPFEQLAGTNAAVERAKKQREDSEAAKARREAAEERKELERQQREERGGLRANAFNRANDLRDRMMQSRRELQAELAPKESPVAKQLKAVADQIERTKSELDNTPSGSGASAGLRTHLAGLQRQQRAMSQMDVPADAISRRNMNRDEMRDSQRELVALRAMAQSHASNPASSDADREAIAARAFEIEQRIIALRKGSITIEREIGEARRKAAEDSIASIKEEIELRRGEQRESRDKLKSAADKFAEMKLPEQRYMMQLKARSNAAGDASMNKEDRAFAMQFEQRRQHDPSSLSEQDQRRFAALQAKRNDAASRVLRPDDARRLASLGLMDDQAVVDAQSQRTWQQTGAARAFGRSEQTSSDLAKSAEKRLEIELRDKRQLAVTVKMDADDIASQAEKRIMPKIEQTTKAMLDNLETRLAARMDRLQKQFTDRNNQRPK